MSFRLKAVLLGFTLWVALVLTLTGLIQYSRTSLLRNGRWVSSKTLQQMPVMGAHHYVSTRNALHRNRLHLDAWHGFNEVHFARMIDPLTVDYRFSLAPGAHLSFLFERDADGHAGIRLSRHVRFPSIFYRADRSGHFLEKHRLGVAANQLEDGWHELRVSFAHRNITAHLDSEPILRTPSGRKEPRRQQMIGIRGGHEPAMLDAVRVTGRDGEVILDETFRHHRGQARVLALVSASGLVLLLPGWVLLFGEALEGKRRRIAAAWLVGLAVALGMSLAFYAFDSFYWSRLYLYEGFTPARERPAKLNLRLEDLRRRVFGTVDEPTTSRRAGGAIALPREARRWLTRWDGRDRVSSNTVAHYDSRHRQTPWLLKPDELARHAEKQSEALRIAFLGTSQTWGVGAETISETFVSRVFDRLVESLPEMKLELFNLARPGSFSRELLVRYAREWRHLDVDLLVISLSNNDLNAVHLADNLRMFVRGTRHAGGRVVLVQEANAIEAAPGRPWLERNHAAMESVGQEMNVPVWDLHGYLASDGVYDSGILWWDEVHLTSYGHRLAGNWIAEQLIPVVTRIAQTNRDAREPAA